MMRRRGARIRQMKHNRLEAALSMQEATSHPETAPLVAVARLLAPGVPERESKAAETKALMLKAHREAFATPSAPPPAHGDDGSTVHVAEVQTPDGVIRMADIEPIDAERASQVAQSFNESKRHTR